MKKYLLTFTCVFCISALISTFYILISQNNSVALNLPTEPTNEESITKNENTINDFTQPIEIDVIENEIIKEPLDFIMPVKSSEIGMKFSSEQLVYSKTLDEWIIHTGIDIMIPIGSPVYASEKGKIIEVSSEVGDGIKIIIEHEDGYKTIYSNLSTTKMVQEGQIIEKGQVISGIGKTSTFEYEENDHLHFEIHKDNKAINPLNLILN